jgi:hypothetical protein
MPLGESAVQAVAVRDKEERPELLHMSAMWRGASERDKVGVVRAHTPQAGAYVLHQRVGTRDGKGYQQQRRVSEMNVEKLIIKRTEEGYELYADEVLLFKTDDADAVEAALEELYKGAQIVPYVKKPQ